MPDYDPLALLGDLTAKAKAAGADAADAVLIAGTSLSLSQRLKAPERVERAEGQDLGLRVFIGRRQAIVSSTDFRPDGLAELVERAVAMARAVPEDPFCGIAEADQLSRSFPDLDSEDPVEPEPAILLARAEAAEAAALEVAGVTNSEGADASWSRTRIALVTSAGFAATNAVTRHSIGVSVLSGEGSGMERDYDYTSTAHADDLEAAGIVGRRAGDKAVRRLNPRRLATGRMSVLFDPRVAGGLLGSLAGAISGPSIARGTSFLKDKMGQQIMPAGVTVIDDPFRRRGMRSRPFDGEGLAPSRRAVIENGVLTTWLLDLRSGRQLGLASTGHASRGTGGPPSPSPANFYFEPGPVTPLDLMADIKDGFYITELMGMGVNMITGDYSRGASGYRIENGVLTHAVSEVTVAGNLNEMFRNIALADDLQYKTGVDAPTLRIDGMMIAGT